MTGPYGVIARAQTPDMNNLAEQVTAQIQAVRGVTRDGNLHCRAALPPSAHLAWADTVDQAGPLDP